MISSTHTDGTSNLFIILISTLSWYPVNISCRLGLLTCIFTVYWISKRKISWNTTL